MAQGREFNLQDRVGERAQDYAALANDIAIIRVTLDVARDKQLLKIGGTFLKAVDASSLNALVNIEFDHYSVSTGLPVKLNGGFRGLKYDKLLLTNTAQAGEWIDILYCAENYRGDFEIFDRSADFTEITVDIGNTLTDDVEQTISIDTTDTIAANAARRRIVIQASPANTDYLRVGATCTDTRGGWLAPGQSATFEVTAAVQVRNMTTGTAFLGTVAGDQVYYYFEEED